MVCYSMRQAQQKGPIIGEGIGSATVKALLLPRSSMKYSPLTHTICAWLWLTICKGNEISASGFRLMRDRGPFKRNSPRCGPAMICKVAMIDLVPRIGSLGKQPIVLKIDH